MGRVQKLPSKPIPIVRRDSPIKRKRGRPCKKKLMAPSQVSVCSCVRLEPTSCKMKSLMCNHEFHEQCINKWLATNEICPVCACKNNLVAPSQVKEKVAKCSVCLDTTRCKKMKSLLCNHEFHEQCINKWLEINEVCPLCPCKKKLVPPSQVKEKVAKCSVCLDTTRCKKMKSLMCNHEFHEQCINKWLETNKICPLCRMPTEENVKEVKDNIDANAANDRDEDTFYGIVVDVFTAMIRGFVNS